MDIAAKAAFIASQVACCQAKLTAMTEQNTSDRAAGRPVTWAPWQFEQVPDEFGLGHNAVISFLRDG